MKKQAVLLAACVIAAGMAASSVYAEGSLRLVNGKIEVDAALKEAAAKYEEETGVHVEIESMGGGVNIQDELKKQYPDRQIHSVEFRVDGAYVDVKYRYESVPFHRIRRITGYLVGDLEKFNNAKRSELNDRVKHSLSR